MQRPVVFLMGATAAGKSALALQLAEHLPVELVSVDSTQVYRGLDIGSAKPDAATRAGVPHHLVDIRAPTETYSAAAFAADATAAIAAIHARGRVPLLVGGTMLYFKALRDGLAELPGADPTVRARIEAQAVQVGWPALHAQLAAVDPLLANRLAPNDRQRVQRALEIYELTGEAPSKLHAAAGRGLVHAPDIQLLQFAVGPPDRHALDAAMAARFQQMLSAGLVAEVENLLRLPGVHAALPSLRAVGYRQVCAYLGGELDLDAMCVSAVQATRGLAKRQYTWLRKWPELHWLAGSEALPALVAKLAAAMGPAPNSSADACPDSVEG